MKGVWWETRPKYKTPQARSLVKKDKKTWQILIEIPVQRFKSMEDGTVVLVADATVDASNIIWVGDQWVKPRVECRITARFTKQQLERIRRDRLEAKNRKDSPVLYTSL